MRAIVGMECRGNTRDALRAVGVAAWSCDLLPDVSGSPYHITGDIMAHLMEVPDGYYDLGIFHPDCTIYTGAAAWAFKDPDFVKYPEVGYHQKVKPGTLTGQARRDEQEKQFAWLLDFIDLATRKCKRWAIENPVGMLSTLWRKPDQTIQPYEFGEDASKRTCLWLHNLPELRGTKRFVGRFVNGVERWSNQTDSGQNKESPSGDRWIKRAETYPGISAAMAQQWALEGS